jgi:predicted ATP-binding protein involved in virulence
LPAYQNLHVADGDPSNLLIDHDGATLEVRQLSDGERGSLAMVLDLTRRLAQANPHLSRPADQAEAVVLIDELDLHLHPKWQRSIARNLTAAFPKCQFIATTHSPQVLGEVQHEQIQMISNGQVYVPTHSFGVDSSRVLEELMDAMPRTAAVQQELANISNAITAKNYTVATDLLATLTAQLGEDDPEVVRTRTFLDFIMDDK